MAVITGVLATPPGDLPYPPFCLGVPALFRRGCLAQVEWPHAHCTGEQTEAHCLYPRPSCQLGAEPTVHPGLGQVGQLPAPQKGGHSIPSLAHPHGPCLPHPQQVAVLHLGKTGFVLKVSQLPFPTKFISSPSAPPATGPSLAGPPPSSPLPQNCGCYEPTGLSRASVSHLIVEVFACPVRPRSSHNQQG